MPGLAISRRETLEIHELAVDELPAHILVEQHHAVAHVVEHGLHDRARLLGLGARRGCFGARAFGGVARGFGGFLGGGERFLALLQLGDVAIDAEQAAVVERLVVEFDVAAVRRAPLVAVAARAGGCAARLLRAAPRRLRPRPKSPRSIW